MTRDELLVKIDDIEHKTNHTPLPLGVQTALLTQNKALRAVVELHKPVNIPTRGAIVCNACVVTISTKINPLQDFEYTAFTDYPCKTIQAIEKELA